MNLQNLLFGLCLLLVVCDFKWLGTGALADDTCHVGGGGPSGRTHHDRRKAVSSARDPFYYSSRPTSIPVKVHCDPPMGDLPRCAKKSEPCKEDERLLKTVREKQKMKNEARRAQESCSTVAATEARRQEEEGTRVRNQSGSGVTTAECEQCEIQIKANGDGILLRCKRCHPTNSEGFRFPTANTNRVAQLP